MLALVLALAATPWIARVGVDRVHVRAAASSAAPVIGALERGDTVAVARCVPDLPTGAPGRFRGVAAPTLPLTLRGRVVAFVRRRPPSIDAAARWVHVDRSRQLLTAYQGDRLVFATLVSTGRAPHATPRGRFRVWHQSIHAAMHGDGADPTSPTPRGGSPGRRRRCPTAGTPSSPSRPGCPRSTSSSKRASPSPIARRDGALARRGGGGLAHAVGSSPWRSRCALPATSSPPPSSAPPAPPSPATSA